MNKEEVLAEIKNSNPYYFIVVASEIAMRYSVEYLRGVSAPDKQYLAIRDLSAARDQIKEPDASSEVGDKVYGLFHSFAKRVLNEGTDIVGEYAEEDLYQAKTSSLELFSKDNEEGDEYDENTYYEDDDDDDDDDIDEDDEDDLQEDDIDDL